ncbi:MAG: 3-methyl-2-oxobutanoate hydroxymethyltransferase, partial [Spirochaetales bacterium]|nr:3-methyl-2-oxobutanoate hydroxymethyltransferase [Spirochaetales bacterium]
MIVTPALLNFLARWRQGEKLAVLTAYDASGASLASAVGVDLILVGDSLGNVVQGMPTTANVTLDQMVYHTRMTARMAKVPVVADLPANTYDSPEI